MKQSSVQPIQANSHVKHAFSESATRAPIACGLGQRGLGGLGQRVISCWVAVALGAGGLSGCSGVTTPFPTEMLATTAIGTAAGTGVGYLFSRERGDTAKNLLINGAIGASAGLLAGAILHDRNVKLAQEREVVQREARVIDENQRELDLLRQRVYDSTSWGRSEHRSFDQRYQVETSELPYQGPIR